ncbi:MAG TPA: 1-(5-phosphoribosyl)-5-[(5-phosphoribosylamino)methylideneamino] imidazole-4-carboxamide isomerase [Candidatus Limnocylindrales bacterium]|nr:1-(5-phosphoribosyl)-5-[(5-phosphoribosylamino)methylideneamino] imidazole-4-carboxamide isomerase [Candidatus Limnocylindrales bacterium]
MSLRKRFDVIPAIDLRAGRVVRLQEGDFDREQVYANEPAAIAAAFGTSGAGWVHVVDLDGARAGERRQVGSIAAIRRELPRTTRLQVGGGIRTMATLAETLAAGADRVVLGTAALIDPGLVRRSIQRHGADRIAIALDVRDGLALGHGWVPGAAGEPVEAAVEKLAGAGVATFVVTAIDRDGLLGGPDLALLERLLALTDAAVIASGGVATIADLLATRSLGCAGAIVGRALYDGRIDLAEAFAAVERDG